MSVQKVPQVQGISFEMAPGNTAVDTGGELVEGLGYSDFTLSFPTQNIDFVNSPPVSLLAQADAWRMIRRRAMAAGIKALIGCHTFRATGITAYLENGGTLEHAQAMAAHESSRTTKLYDRTKERLTLDEIERIRL
jgi:integrase